MSGIMFGAALKGIGDGITSLGGSAMSYEREDERRRLQEQMLRERLDSSERNVDARIAAKLGGSGGGTKGVIDYKEGSQGEETLAADMGMTVPELRRFRAANKTGDMSGYETDQPVPNGDNVMDPRDSMVAENKTTRGVTAATQKYLADKRKMLGEITRMYQQGDAYDDSAKGRETVQRMDAAKGIMSGTMSPQKVSQAYLATEGKGLVDNLGESGTFGKSGEGQELNALGRAKAADENASAAARGAKADGAGALKVRSTKDIDGRTVAIMSDGSMKDLGASTAVSKTVAQLILKKEELDSKFKKLPADEKRRIVSEEMLGMPAAPAKDQPPPSAAPAASAQNPKPSQGDDKFTVGKVYKDAKGNRAEYLGGGRWRNI